MSQNIFSPHLLDLSAEHLARLQRPKSAFVDPAALAAGDPAAAGGGPAAAGGDPAAGGAPPPGGDPMAAGGGAPPPGGGGGGMTPEDIQMMIQQSLTQMLPMMMQQMGGGGMAGGGGGGAGGAGGQKMKVDVNQEIYQIKKLLVMLAGQQGLSIPPEMLLGDPAMDPSVPPQEAAKDPMSAAATQSGQGLGSAIQPIQPIQGASPQMAAQDQAAQAQKAAIDAGSVHYAPRMTDLVDQADWQMRLYAGRGAS